MVYPLPSRLVTELVLMVREFRCFIYGEVKIDTEDRYHVTPRTRPSQE